MNKTELVKEVSKLSGVTQKDTLKVVNTLGKVVLDKLYYGVNVKIKDFISFTLKVSPSTRRVNPQTKEDIEVPAKYRVKTSLPTPFLEKLKTKTVYEGQK